MIGLRADAPNKCLYVDPDLPRWLPDVTLHGLSVGAGKVDLRIWRDGDRSLWDATTREGAIEVTQQAWQPWVVQGEKP